MTAQETVDGAGRRKLDPRVGQGDTFRAAPRAAYRSPCLRELGCAADLLEALGPAQANYGGPNVL